MDGTFHTTCPQCREVVAVPQGQAQRPTCPRCREPLLVDAQPADDPSERETYNIVSDLATGVNIRKKDNLYQLATIGIGLLLGAVIGFFCTSDHAPGAIVGGFVGVLVGLFGSGIYLMIYRFVRHLQGHHK